MKKIRVLHINNTGNKSGVSLSLEELVRILKKKNISSKIYISKYTGNIFYKFITKLIKKFIFNPFQSSISLNIFPSNFIENINNSNIDVVNFHWIGNDILSIEEMGKITKPVVWSLYDMWPFTSVEHYTFDNDFINGYKKKKFSLKYFFFKRKLKSYKKKWLIVSASSWLFMLAKKSILLKKNKNFLIPHPINFNFWKPQKKNNFRKKFNMDKDKFLILFIGHSPSNNYRKGFDLLLDSVALLDNYLQKKISIICFGGQGRKYINYKFPIHYINANYSKKFRRSLYSASDLMASPSRLENLSMTCLESNSCGLPNIIFDKTGLVDIVKHNYNGYVAKSFSKKDFANGLKKMITKKSFLRKISLNCRKSIIKNFNEKDIARSYSEVYKSFFKEY